MGLKKYIGFSLLLILVVGLYVYSVENADYTVNVFGSSIILPLAVWFLLPIIVLFILSVAHMIFYGSINFLKNKNYLKDEETFVENIKSLLICKEDKKKFKTPTFKNIASILNQLELNVKDNTFTSKDETLNQLVSNIKDINLGKYVNEKNLKLNSDSKLYEKNLINKVNEQVDFALDILKKPDQYSQNILKIAFLNVVENKSITTIKKVYGNLKLDKEMALKLFLKDIDNNEFGLSKEEVLKITKELDYSKEEYITLAKLYKEALTPDKLIELFETISENIDLAMEAYLYVLLEFEMIDKLREILSSHDKEDYKVFRALLDLKDSGKHYSLDELIIK